MKALNSARQWKVIFAATASCVLGIQVVAILVSAYAISYPNIFKRISAMGTCAAPDGAQTVEIRSRGGHQLVSWYFQNVDRKDAVLICHGRSSSKANSLPYIQALSQQYSVLAIDFRGHGQNPYGRTSIGFRESEDVLGALDWLYKKGVTNVAIFGHSMGAAAAIKAVSEHSSGCPQVRALALEGVFDDLGVVLSHHSRKWFQPCTTRWGAFAIAEALCGYRIAENVPAEFVKNVGCPILVMNATNDEPLPPGSGMMVYDNAVNEKEFLVFCGRHDVFSEEVLQRVLSFFDQNMP